jgi:hypothetical protein
MTSIEALQLEEGMDSGSFATNVLLGMKEEVRSITKLTGDLLHLARSDSGDFVLGNVPFDLRKTAHSVV